jgi:hypothetical protein
MTGLDLDQQMRNILANLTRENVLSSIEALHALGFGINASAHLALSVLAARDSK